VTHYFGRINVAALTIAKSLYVGDTVHILGHTTDLRQKILSMQIEHESVEEAHPGQDVAFKVDRRVRPGDKVFKIAEEGE
jgi:putative protease